MSLFATGVRPVIDDFLLLESAKKRDYGEYWSASSAGYCMRKVIFERLGVPPVTEDARKQRVFTSGDIFHEWVQGITQKAGISVAQELQLQDEDLMIRGHIDDLILVDDHLVLYDYKTKHSRWFGYIKDSPMSHYHRHQLGTYMYMLRKINNLALSHHKPIESELLKDLTEARILSISKDDLRMFEQQLMWSPDLEKEIVGYWSTLNGYWKSKKMPECTCGLYEVNSRTGVGFMADPKYNPFYYNGEPCSLDWLKQYKEK